MKNLIVGCSLVLSAFLSSSTAFAYEYDCEGIFNQCMDDADRRYALDKESCQGGEDAEGCLNSAEIAWSYNVSDCWNEKYACDEDDGIPWWWGD